MLRLKPELILLRNWLQMNPVVTIRSFWQPPHLLFALPRKNQLESNRKRNSRGHVVNTAHRTRLPRARRTETKKNQGHEVWNMVWKDSSIAIALRNHASLAAFLRQQVRLVAEARAGKNRPLLSTNGRSRHDWERGPLFIQHFPSYPRSTVVAIHLSFPRMSNVPLCDAQFLAFLINAMTYRHGENCCGGNITGGERNE